MSRIERELFLTGIHDVFTAVASADTKQIATVCHSDNIKPIFNLVEGRKIYGIKIKHGSVIHTLLLCTAPIGLIGQQNLRIKKA